MSGTETGVVSWVHTGRSADSPTTLHPQGPHTGLSYCSGALKAFDTAGVDVRLMPLPNVYKTAHQQPQPGEVVLL